jgi:hypothetical protein
VSAGDVETKIEYRRAVSDPAAGNQVDAGGAVTARPSARNAQKLSSAGVAVLAIGATLLMSERWGRTRIAR